MKHLYAFNKFFESFADNFNADGWLEFDGTSAYTHLTFNSWDHFRDGRKRINPQDIILEQVKDILEKYLNNKIVNLKWRPEFKQLYCHMYSDKTHMSYKEREKSNRKLLIVDFYDDNWIFCSIINYNDSIVPVETHFVCDDIFGFENFIKNKKEYLMNR